MAKLIKELRKKIYYDYDGEFKDDLPNGRGTFTYPDGETYVGEWKDGQKNGQGTYTLPDGKKLSGEWKDSV